MKRIFVEWGAIFSFGLAVLSITFWGVTSLSDVAYFEIAPLGYFHISATSGELLLCDSFGNREVIQYLDRNGIMVPMPSTRRRFSVPGFHVRYYRFTDQCIWSVRISLALLAAIFAAAAAIFVRQYRIIRRQPCAVIHVLRETWPADD
jgi:hypothetical protein